MDKNVNLNTKQLLAYEQIRSGRNVYLGGSGGVGKSFLVQYIMKMFANKAVLAAPTGIAALNIGGSTINSLFKLPLHILTEEDFGVKQKVYDLFNVHSPVKMLIIDEISMVRLDKLHAIDKILRKCRMVDAPFGGLQVIVVGDFFQLSPVLGTNEKHPYFSVYRSEFAFGDRLWFTATFEYIELTEVVRQTDVLHIEHLQRIRKKSEGYQESVDFFNALSEHNYATVTATVPLVLCSTNAAADKYNIENYNFIDEKEFSYTGMIKGAFNPKDVVSPIDLKLKLYTKVVFTANGADGYKNGQTGYIIDINKDNITVLIEDSEEEVKVVQHVWRLYDTVVVNGKLTKTEIGSYTQYPLKHGWAVTIHKAQGLTLSNGLLDFGQGCFAPGQAYVGLSRIKDIHTFAFSHPMRYSDVIVNEQVVRFYEDNCIGYVG
jgi:ATP-dependent DNA helicase PIF1